MRKEEGKGGGESRGGDPGWEDQIGRGGGRKKAPRQRERDPVGRLSSARKQCGIFFKATDLIS